ncbi:F0F1 ATP synthase assembly protein I [Komagataeibacter rhaeticus]|uniref:ATP synthase protein I n=1 Tax=Komagataeibacter rhaeticus TaxID=215221 RepID=A0A858JLK9_9PROT|nr:AtpZ/AtpI family protein [Komagataeibacter rhaeticus]ATU74498.1 F0F1 ATP synthase assembly protein I [Komagataeibacter xylinus]EGG77897.1 ATP synthase protein I [Gluconacetobacter sp. SXCC-1]KDU97580.1 ATP synthase I [Komagataeibacter rhaeticus AF1]PYD55217.1 F0F1 ATP synthase assembly protein I [Komagataeibacter rhaeticus]QIP36524.1 AtpZ/AtpI family protein [Komagataeibacter rhaeticus]
MDKDNDPSGESFNRRLEAARERLEPRMAARQETGGTLSDLGLVVRSGTELVSALVVGVAIGWGLDHWLHARPWFLIVFSLLGGVAGVLNVWRLVRPDAINTKAEGPDDGSGRI